MPGPNVNSAARALDEDEVVISGVGGHFPECNDMETFGDCLMKNECLLTENAERWKPGKMDVSPLTGKVTGIDKFDTVFFGMHRKLTDATDPMSRILMERVFEAIVDAGMNPAKLRGTRTGVFIGSALSESENIFIQTTAENGFGIMGHNRSMMANRISYYFDFKGPSYALDCSFASGVQVLEIGKRAIECGECDMAIVGSATLSFHPEVTHHYTEIGFIAQDGVTKPFDKDAHGWARCEAVLCMVLQRKSTAHRVYASVVHVKTSDFGGEHDSTLLDINPRGFVSLLDSFYDECGVHPDEVVYLEAEGSGHKVWDKLEVDAVDEVICKRRSRPLLVGSTKPNSGHGEASSFLISLCKVLVAMERGCIPATLNYSMPNPDLLALVEGRMEVVKENTPWDGGLVALNSFGLSNLFGHVLLRSHSKKKEPMALQDAVQAVPQEAVEDSDMNAPLPRLAIISARNEEGMDHALQKVNNTPPDPEYVRLLQEVFGTHVYGHLQRAYTFMPKTEGLPQEVSPHGGGRRPVWFVFSGMGSQWPGMGRGLLRVPICRRALERCHRALKPHNVDLMHIVTTKDAGIFDNILHSFVGIAAIQIALTDLLKALGIEPDGIIGHSVGELGCAYADGCFTPEQMILAAHARGRASIETELIRGTMAAVGLGYSRVKDMVPPTIEVACHNSDTSCTISGPSDDMLRFVADLKNKGIFAKAVNVSNIAYHSRYIAPAGPKLLELLREVIPDPKPRSERWVSTSVPEDRWGTPLAQTSSADYHTNNLLSSVLFEEGSKKIPKDAIVIEIAPHGLLQAILRRALSSATHIPLTKRDLPDGAVFLLQAVGKMYLSGLSPMVHALYEPVPYPVSRGTPGLAGLVRWDHAETWYTGRSSQMTGIVAGEKHMKLSLLDSTYRAYGQYLWMGHSIITPGVIIEQVSNIIFKINDEEHLPMVFEDVHFHGLVDFPHTSEPVLLYVMYQRGSGRFECSVDLRLVATGRAHTMPTTGQDSINRAWSMLPPRDEADWVLMSQNDIYDELTRCGLCVEGDLKTILHLTVSPGDVTGRMRWTGSRMFLLEALLQIYTVMDSEKLQELRVPHRVQRILVDPDEGYLSTDQGPLTELVVRYNVASGVLRCAGLELKGVTMRTFSALADFNPVQVDGLYFLPQGDLDAVNLPLKAPRDLLSACLELVCQQTCLRSMASADAEMAVVELQEDGAQDVLAPLLSHVAEVLGGAVVHAVAAGSAVGEAHARQSMLLVAKGSALPSALHALGPVAFLLARLAVQEAASEPWRDWGAEVVIRKTFGSEAYVLLKKVEPVSPAMAVLEGPEDLSQLADLPALQQPTVLVWRRAPPGGTAAVLQALRPLAGSHRARCVFLDADAADAADAPAFSAAHPLYARQLRLGLSVNRLRGGVWGSFLHLPHAELVDVQPRSNPLPRALPTLQELAQVDVHCLGLNPMGLEPTNLAEQVKRILAEMEKPKEDRVNKGAGSMDYAGLRDGQPVMGLLPPPNCITQVQPDADLEWPVPAGWSLEEAATVPYAYATAYFALVHVARLKPGESLLVHDAWSAVGQAALDVALGMDCSVFATFRVPEERDLILERFPQLPPSRVLTLQEERFEMDLQVEQKGKGVLVVLSMLRGEGYCASLRCVGVNGRLVQLNSSDTEHDVRMGMFVFLKSASVFGIDSDGVLRADPAVKRLVQRWVDEGLQRGVVRPLDHTALPASRVHDALRYLLGDVTDKVVLQMKTAGALEVRDNRYQCDPKRTYLIVGGQTCQWLQLTDWLLTRGARCVLLAGQTTPLPQVAMRRLALLRGRYQANIVTAPGIQPHTQRGASALLRRSQELAPLSAAFVLPTGRFLEAVQALTAAFPPSVLLVALTLGYNELVAAECTLRRGAGGQAVMVELDTHVEVAWQKLLGLDTALLNPPPVVSLHQLTQPLGSSKQTYETRLSNFLPTSVHQLEALGRSLIDDKTTVFTLPTFRGGLSSKECPPVFLVAGISSSPPEELGELAKTLHATAYVLTPPARASVAEGATLLTRQVRSRQAVGPYTLVGRGWAGCVVLEMARILEDAGQRVAVFLVDAAPDTALDVIRGLGEGRTFETKLLSRLVQLDAEAADQVELLPTWSERVQAAIKLAEVSPHARLPVVAALDAIHDRLLALRVHCNQIAGYKLVTTAVTLVRQPGSDLSDCCGLDKVCTLTPVVVVPNSPTGSEALWREVAASVSAGLWVGKKPMHLIGAGTTNQSEQLWHRLR